MSNAFNAEVVVDDAFRYSKSYRVRYKGNMCVTSFSVDYNFERIFFWKKNCEGQGWVFFLKKDFEIESKKKNIPNMLHLLELLQCSEIFLSSEPKSNFAKVVLKVVV